MPSGGHYVRHFGVGSTSTEYLPQYIKGLHSETETGILNALTYIRYLEKHGAPALPGVLELLSHRSTKVRIAALECCGEIGVPNQETVNQIKPFLDSEDRLIRIAALYSVSLLQPPSQDRYRELLKLRQDKKEPIRLAAYRALGRLRNRIFGCLVSDALLAEPVERVIAIDILDRPPGAIQRAIVSLVCWYSLLETNADVRGAAAYGVARAGCAICSRIELAALSKIMRNDPDDRVRRRAVEGLTLYENILPDLAYRELVFALQDASPHVRSAGYHVSNFINRKRSIMGKQLAPPLVELLSDNRPEIRKKALDLLGWCGHAAIDAIPAIAATVIFDSDWNVKKAGVDALRSVIIGEWHPPKGKQK